MEHYWRDLPGPIWFCGANIYRRFVGSVVDSAVAVELGAWKGRSAACMGVEIANSGKAIQFSTVDHWQGSRGEDAHDADPDVRAGRLYEVFLENIRPVAEFVRAMKSDTAVAAGQFDDESIDFLYVDASHTYDGVLRDLHAWYPKVKPGGLIAGDDWCFSDRGELGVRFAVTDFFGPSLSCVTIEPGSPPNEGWLQWSVIKQPQLAVASPRELKRARAGRTLRRVLTARRLRHRLRFSRW